MKYLSILMAGVIGVFVGGCGYTGTKVEYYEDESKEQEVVCANGKEISRKEF